VNGDLPNDPSGASELADQPITGADLRRLMDRNKVLRTDYVSPSASALDGLALDISVLRGRCRVGRREAWSAEARRADDLRRMGSAALATLAEILPEMRAECAAAFERADKVDPMRLMFSQHIAEISALERVVADTWERPWITPMEEQQLAVIVGSDWAIQVSPAYKLPPPPAISGVSFPPDIREMHKWHHFAHWLAERFRDVVQAANPNLQRLALSNNGPVVRFFLAVIPHITGEAPTAAAVRKRLRDHPQEGGLSPIAKVPGDFAGNQKST